MHDLALVAGDTLLPAQTPSSAAILDTIWESYSANTRAAYRCDFAQLIEFLAKTPLVTLTESQLHGMLPRITSHHVFSWRRSLESEKCSGSTIARKLAGVRSVFAACIEAGIATKNPAVGRRFVVKSQQRIKTSSTPSKEQFVAIGRHFSERARLAYLGGAAGSLLDKRNMGIFSLIAYAGARCGDVVGLTLDCWEEAHRTDDGAAVVMLLRKGGKERPLTVPPAAVEWTNAYIVARQENLPRSLFLTNRHTPVTRRGIYYLISTGAKQCGFATHPHAFRHFMATQTLDLGATLEEVRSQLGHATTTMARRYDDRVRASTGWRHLEHLNEKPEGESGSHGEA